MLPYLFPPVFFLGVVASAVFGWHAKRLQTVLIAVLVLNALYLMVVTGLGLHVFGYVYFLAITACIVSGGMLAGLLIHSAGRSISKLLQGRSPANT